MKNLFNRFVLLLLILLIITFLSLPVMAAEEDYGVEMDEIEKEGWVMHRLSNLPAFEPTDLNNELSPNEAYIEQLGNYNFGIIEQIGEGNYAEIIQKGNDNNADIFQVGYNNKAEIEQHANDCNARIEQYGKNHYSEISQNEDGNHEIIQKGINNTVSSSIFGYGAVSIEQMGTNMNLSVESLFTN